MFGADTSLVVDALQIAALAITVGGAGAWFLLRKRTKNKKEPSLDREKNDLEDRVRVLERIATDRSIGLADEIENLRGPTTSKELT